MNSKFNQEKGLLPNSPTGFTLLEVLVAIVILSVGLLGMACLTGSIIGYNQFADQVTTATTLAQDEIEELKNTGYSSISDSASPETLDAIYTRSWTAPEANDMKTITVTVSWNWKNDQHDVILKTIIAK